MLVYLHPELKKIFSNEKNDKNEKNIFNFIMNLRGTSYREQSGRRTQRITLGRHHYFIKQHFGVGWKEILKNLIQGRLPVLGAKNEWKALQQLQATNLHLPEALGYGFKGKNPATQRSFLITRELPAFITLEDFCKYWKEKPPTWALKKVLIQQVAEIANTLHQNGVNHRDFYLCHFLLDLLEYSKNNITIYLIDLHRAELRDKTPDRWLIKDLAGLYFSSKEIGLTRRDLWRFIKFYRKQSLRDVLTREPHFWWKVLKRGERSYRKHNHS